MSIEDKKRTIEANRRAYIDRRKKHKRSIIREKQIQDRWKQEDTKRR